MIEEVLKYYQWNNATCIYDPFFIAKFRNADGALYYGPIHVQQMLPEENFNQLLVNLNIVSEPLIGEAEQAQMLAKALHLEEEAKRIRGVAVAAL